MQYPGSLSILFRDFTTICCSFNSSIFNVLFHSCIVHISNLIFLSDISLLVKLWMSSLEFSPNLVPTNSHLSNYYKYLHHLIVCIAWDIFDISCYHWMQSTMITQTYFIVNNKFSIFFHSYLLWFYIGIGVHWDLFLSPY